jgi:coenzyme PQQ precursor peptide PqqA
MPAWSAICLKRINWRTFSHEAFSGGDVHPVKKGRQMAWKAPKILEVSVGMEINMYMCATRK